MRRPRGDLCRGHDIAAQVTSGRTIASKREREKKIHRGTKTVHSGLRGDAEGGDLLASIGLYTTSVAPNIAGEMAAPDGVAHLTRTSLKKNLNGVSLSRFHL